MGHGAPAQTAKRTDREERRDEGGGENALGVVSGQQQRPLCPFESDTSIARSVSVAFITASASAANSRSAYAAGFGGLSDRPFPRGSKVTTRQCRAR